MANAANINRMHRMSLPIRAPQGLTIGQVRITARMMTGIEKQVTLTSADAV
jgi:hypothetical protein